MENSSQRDQLEPTRADDVSRGSLYELWDVEELRRHVSILETELQRLIPFARDAQTELDALRAWKADVEASRTWHLARRLARVSRLPSRARRIVASR